MGEYNIILSPRRLLAVRRRSRSRLRHHFHNPTRGHISVDVSGVSAVVIPLLQPTPAYTM